MRKGINYLKSAPSSSSLKANVNVNSNINTNTNINTNNIHKNTNNAIYTKNKVSNNNHNISSSSSITKIGSNSSTNRNNNNNNNNDGCNSNNNLHNKAIFSSFQEGYQFTAEDLWQRMRTRGGKKNASIGPFDHTRISLYSQSNSHSHSQSDLKAFSSTNVTKNFNRKNSIGSASNDNLGSFSTYGHIVSTTFLKKHPQPLTLRQDVVTYSDGTNYGTQNNLSLLPTTAISSTSTSSSSFSTTGSNILKGDSDPNASTIPSSSSSSTTPIINPISTSLTTSFTTSPFVTTLLSKQVMGTVVLPDLIVLTNEIPWCSVASEFTILTTDDISFDLFGKYIRSVPL